MEIQTSPEALGLATYQVVIAVLGVLILFALTWRAMRAFNNRVQKAGQSQHSDLVHIFWPPAAWALLLVIGAIVFSTFQAYGPRVAIKKTPLTVNAPKDAKDGIRDLSPKETSDEERVRQQRKLEAETRERVNLPAETKK